MLASTLCTPVSSGEPQHNCSRMYSPCAATDCHLAFDCSGPEEKRKAAVDAIAALRVSSRSTHSTPERETIPAAPALVQMPIAIPAPDAAAAGACTADVDMDGAPDLNKADSLPRRKRSSSRLA